MKRHLLDGLTRNPFQQTESFNPDDEEHIPLSWHNRILIDVVGPDGVVKQRAEATANVMNTYGLSYLASLIVNSGTISNWLQAIQLGTSSGFSPATNDGGLGASTGTQVTMNQNNGTGTCTLSLVSPRTIQVNATFPSNNPAGAATIGEVALYCYTTSTSNLAAHGTVSPVVNKGASDVIQVSYQIIATTA